MVRLALAALAAVIGLVVGAGAIPATMGTFSSQTSNAGNTFAAAASFCSSQGSQTVAASKDASIHQDTPATNSGTTQNLFVQSQSVAKRRSLIAFDLPAVPSGCSALSATLRLNATSSASGRTLEALRVDSSWTETGVTWDNQPGTSGAAATSASGSGWRSWDVTSTVRSMYSGANHGFLLRDQTEGASGGTLQIYASRESSSNVPELTVTWG